MRRAIIADIHADRSALEAVLADIAQQSADQMVFLGDYVGHGPDIDWVMQQIEYFAAQGAVMVRGNHDRTQPTPAGTLNAEARRLVDYTVTRLTARQRLFLEDLPLTAWQDDALFSHGSAHDPQDWHSVSDPSAAAQAFAAQPQARVMFCGHSHVPALYFQDDTGDVMQRQIPYGHPIDLSAQPRWLVVAGSVGLPRDGTQMANYCLWDSAQNTLTFHRIGYDSSATLQRAKAAHMPLLFMRRMTR